MVAPHELSLDLSFLGLFIAVRPLLHAMLFIVRVDYFIVDASSQGNSEICISFARGGDFHPWARVGGRVCLEAMAEGQMVPRARSPVTESKINAK